ELLARRLGGQSLNACREALAHELEHKAVGGCENQRVVGRPTLGRQRPNPSIELLRGELLLESPQARVPEVLHLLVGLKRVEILPASRWVIHREMRVKCERIFDLTMHSGARSNTALFRTRGTDEAHLPAVQDASRAASRVSRAQQDARRARGFAQPARTRPPSPRTVIVVAAAQKRFVLNAARRLR